MNSLGYQEGFYDVTRVVDGAEEDARMLATSQALEEYFHATRKAFSTYGPVPELVEVYATWHGHPSGDVADDIECSCVQYALDGHPSLSITLEDRLHFCECLVPGCGYVWDDRLEPTPAARCPREYDHEYEDDEDTYDIVLPDPAHVNVKRVSVPFAGDWPAEVAAALAG